MDTTRTRAFGRAARCAALGIGVLSVISAAARTVPAAVIVQTGFESPFVPGPLHGQHGWTTFSGPNGVTVSMLNPQTGGQALQMNGSGLAAGHVFPPGVMGAEAFHEVQVDAVADGTPIVTVQASFRLDGPSTDRGGGIADDRVSVNLVAWDWDEVVNGGYYITDMMLSSNGYAYATALDSSYRFGTPVTLGQYHTLGLQLNYLARTSDYFLDGRLLGTLPFGERVSNGFMGAALVLGAEDAPDLDRGAYTASIDNYSVEVGVPEPTGLTLFGMAGAGLLCSCRRRTRTCGEPTPSGACRE